MYRSPHHERRVTRPLPAASTRRAPTQHHTRGARTGKGRPFTPPEDWHEPRDNLAGANPKYRIIVQDPGPGYAHVVTPEQVRARLAQLPPRMLAPLQVIQLSRMTRKKRTCPCYGMQWGNSLYLYPIETGLVEHFVRPPRPAERIEAAQHGGRWEHEGREWRLVWTREAIEDFYLNNILIHELGHLLDDRNRSYVDRERYAEWFALEYGYKPSRSTRRDIRARHG